jgi:hypothetical protein
LSSALLGSADEIKEQTIGSAVLRRTGNFDPASDNIVRVRARQLRQKLEQYFQSEGTSEPLVLTIPRGGYIPLFESRPVGPAAAPEPAPSAPLGRHIPAALPWALSAVLAAACLVVWFASPRTKARVTLSRNSRLLWSQVFGKGERTLVVLSDPGFGIWQALSHKDLTLQEYLSLQYTPGTGSPQPDLSRLLGNSTISLSAAHFLTSAIPITEVLDATLRVRPARQTDVNDFKSGNVILFGSRRSNPWAELFEPRLHYAAVYPEGARSFFRERATKEPPIMFPTNGRPGAPPTDSYALIALLPNLANTGKVLFIEGLTMEGTDAVSEFLLNPQSCDLLVGRIIAELGSLKPFEALLQLTPISGGSANVRLVRLHAPLL